MDTTFGQWGRLIWWLAQGQNAAAIQALSAAATLALTIVIACITFKYVKLTSGSVELARAQFRADLQPKLTFSITRSGSSPQPSQAMIVNVGSRALRIISIGISLFDQKNVQPISPRIELSRWRDVTLVPSDKLTFDVNSELILSIAKHAELRHLATWLEVYCADVLNLADHTFMYRCESSDVLYFNGPVQWTVLEERFRQRR